MPIDAEQVSKLAETLDHAERTRIAVGLFSLQYPDMTIADGYAIQKAWMGRRTAAGRKVVGHKIGLTSRAMQRSSGISEPDYGVLLDDMVLHDGQDTACDRFIVPRVEVELAFLLEKDIRGPDATLFDVLDATAFVSPALEIIDARILRSDPNTGTPRKVQDTISDNAASAAIVLGGRPVRPDSFDMRWASALLYRNGIVEESGVAAAVLNHPARGIVWLANKLASHGDHLSAGEIVLSGSFTAPVTISAGDTFQADYGPLGTIGIRFT